MGRRERRLKKQEEREEKKEKRQQKIARKRKIKSIATWSVVAIAVVAAVVWVISQNSDRIDWPFGSVHWHADVTFDVCNEPRGIDHLGSSNNHFGGQIVHTHGDGVYHLEGNPRYMDMASLGVFFDLINVPFTEKGVFEYADGSPCPDGSSGMSVLVNDEPVTDFMSYVPKDGDTIHVVYGGA